MADTFGLVPIPLVAPATMADATADPFLTTTLAFFKAVLNANAPAAWQAVFKDVPNAPVVSGTLDNDPRDSGFNDNMLPALFLWREDVKDPYWLAEDWLVQESVCRLLWVMPPAVQPKKPLRSSIINGIARVLTTVVERNRDPSWVVATDPDKQAPTRGSRFSTYAGWMEFYVGAWKPYDLAIPMLDGAKPRMYDAVSIACRVLERLNYDLTLYDASAGVELTLKTPDGGVGDGGFVTGITRPPNP